MFGPLRIGVGLTRQRLVTVPGEVQEETIRGGGWPKKLEVEVETWQKRSQKGTWDAEFGALPRVVGGPVTDENQALLL